MQQIPDDIHWQELQHDNSFNLISERSLNEITHALILRRSTITRACPAIMTQRHSKLKDCQCPWLSSIEIIESKLNKLSQVNKLNQYWLSTLARCLSIVVTSSNRSQQHLLQVSQSNYYLLNSGAARIQAEPHKLQRTNWFSKLSTQFQ